jgi:glycosyltransferase involved in cell wall biosynthesis
MTHRPVRVLHVVGRMHRGGIETWLMQLLRTADRDRLQMDFLVNSADAGDYDDEIRSLGSRVIPCLRPSSPLRYGWNFLAALRRYGPYDVVHSHVHHFTGLVLGLARLGRVPVRIAHSHSDTTHLDVRAGAPRRVYLDAMRLAIRTFATRRLAASEVAAVPLFGPDWRSDRRCRVFHCALDFSPFGVSRDRLAVRRELGISDDALVVGHVGRFRPEKNHAFLLRVTAALCDREPRTIVVLVGEGELRSSIETDISLHGLRNRIVFTGVRSDVSRLMAAFDVFLFPSLHEGLPLVGLEAQAAGLPVVLSDSITREVQVVDGLLHWCSLADSPSVWADRVLRAARTPAVPQSTALAQVQQSDFSLARSFRTLEAEYGVP